MIQNLHKTLGSTVFEDLFQKIESGFYPEGSKLPAENELVSIYGVSRPIVRNALRALREQGYIESTKGLGSFVTRNKSLKFMDFRPVVAQEDMLRCYEYRAAFEGVMAAQAALRRNTKDCVQLQKSYEEVEKVTNSSPEKIWEADIRFHETIADASHNRFFIQALQAIRFQMSQGMNNVSLFFKADEARHALIRSTEHSLILEAILKGDPEMAKAAMTLHLERSKNWLN